MRTRRRANKSRSVSLLVLMGLVFIGVGVLAGVLVAPQAQVEADRVEAIPSLSLATLEDSRPGVEAMLEGALSARNPPRFRNFVAYVREEYRGSDDDGDSQWIEDERATPPLLVELGGGLAQIGNSSYQISGIHEHWSEGGFLRWNSATGEGTKRYKGLVAGRPVLAIGTIQAGPEGNVLWAHTVFGGTRAMYIAGLRNTARFLPIFGLVFGAVGALLLGIGVWIGLRS